MSPVKFAIHDISILKRRRLHTSYYVSTYIDSFSMEEGWGQQGQSLGHIKSYTISGDAVFVSDMGRKLNKKARKFSRP